MGLLIYMLICLFYILKFAAPSVDNTLPPILFDGVDPDEELLWHVTQTYQERDLNPENYRCLQGPGPIPDNSEGTDFEDYDFILRAFTVPEWPTQLIMTYVVKFLEFRKLGCDAQAQASLTGSSPLSCAFLTPNGGPDGKIKAGYGDVTPLQEYEVCSAGSMQGYTLVLALYGVWSS